jgi:hypothetical protein
MGNRGNIRDRMQVHCSQKLSSAWPRRLSMPAVTMAMSRFDQAKFQDQAPITGNSKPNVGVLTELGHHELIMGHEGSQSAQH